MNEATGKLQTVLNLHLEQSNFELIGIVPVPTHSDKMVRQSTLQEMIEEWDDNHTGGSQGYFIQIRPKKSKAAASPDPLEEGEHLPNGKLNIPYLLKNANLLFEAKDFSSAKSLYKAVLSSGESSGFALFKLGQCFEAEGKLVESQKCYENAIAYQPSVELFKSLTSILIRQNNHQKAAEIFERSLLLEGLDLALQFELHKACGNCFTRVNQTESAKRHFKQALEINPSADEIRSNLGTLHLQNHEIDDAKRNFRDSIASNPRNALALAGLGTCYLAEGNKKEAHDYFLQSLEINIQNPTALFHLVKCAYELKNYASATRILKNYCEIAPVNANLLFSLAGLQFHLGRIQEAKLTTQKIIQLQPQHQGAQDLLKRVESYMGEKNGC